MEGNAWSAALGNFMEDKQQVCRYTDIMVCALQVRLWIVSLRLKLAFEHITFHYDMPYWPANH